MTTTHKHYELAKRAHYNTSFSPDKRGRDFCVGFDADIAALQAAGVPEQKIARYEALVVRHLQVKSRCLSSMITGGSNFPVRRAEKANRAERTASEAATDYYNKIVKEAKQEAYYAAHPEDRPVMGGDADALPRLRDKLEAAKKYHAQLKQVRALIRTGATNDEASAQAGLSEPVRWHSFNIQYANKVVKELEAKTASLEAAKAKPTTETIINGVRVLENTEAMRLQLFFDGKPSPEIIKTLKGHGFKWSPSNAAWQRLLNNNAIYAFRYFIKPILEA